MTIAIAAAIIAAILWFALWGKIYLSGHRWWNTLAFTVIMGMMPVILLASYLLASLWRL